MKPRLLLLALALGVLPSVAAPLPHLEPRGDATQLIVDGQPYLILGGELTNTAVTDAAHLETAWANMARLNLNTVLVAVGWAWVEPVEGEFDFALVDRVLAGARARNLRLCLLWFGSWKNGLSSFVPAWVKADSTRFPRVRIGSGAAVEILSPFSASSLQADRRAYVRLLEHLAKVDAAHTVVMIQLQNELGVLGDSRDRSAAAEAAFAGAVPSQLITHLAAPHAPLSPALAERWASAGQKTSGSWSEVFGSGVATDELFMAWHFGRYLEAMAAAGKAAYPLPVFTNTWIVQPEDQGPGDYPSGGPQPHSLDVWKAAAPSIDLNAPDIYLPDFPVHAAAFHRPDNPLFVPESRGDASGVANAFYCIGAHAAIGYSPFGIDHLARLTALRPSPGTPAPTDLEQLPLARGYAVLHDLAPLILEHQAQGTISAVTLNAGHPSERMVLGDYTLEFALRKNRRTGAAVAELGYALALALGPDEYLIAANDVQVTFTPRAPDSTIAGIAEAELGRLQAGRWVPARTLSGDDILLNYRLAEAAAARQSGSGLQFGPDGPTIQRVRLYRYE